MNILRKIFFYLQYLGNPPWDTGISPPELMDFIHNHSPGRALDLGCGTGTNVITLAKHGWQVTGVDFVGRAIQDARQKARKVGVNANLLVDDVTRLDKVSGKFDLVLDIGCFHSLDVEGRSRYVKNLERLLAKDGTFLIYAFCEEPGDTGSGITQDDIQAISQYLTLLDRENGTERGRRPSVWMTFVQNNIDKNLSTELS